MVELLCQKEGFVICKCTRLEEMDDGLDDGSWGLVGQQLINKGVNFENHGRTEHNSMEKFKASFNVLIYYVLFSFYPA